MSKQVIFLLFLTLCCIGCENDMSKNASSTPVEQQITTQQLLLNKWVLAEYDVSEFITNGRGSTWSPQKQQDLDAYMKNAIGKMYFELQEKGIYKSTPAPNVIIQGSWNFDSANNQLSMKANQMTEGASKTTIYTIKSIDQNTLKVSSDEEMLLTFRAHK
ncbi:MAG: hypothetical protein GY810_05820 [Aureispira sp.]|nr:hypothetical protein [Aureispira sp.]